MTVRRPPSLTLPHIMVEGGRDERMRDTGYGMRDTGYGMRDTGYGMRDTGCEIRDTGYGMRDTGCEMRDTRYELGTTLHAQSGESAIAAEALMNNTG